MSERFDPVAAEQLAEAVEGVMPDDYYRTDDEPAEDRQTLERAGAMLRAAAERVTELESGERARAVVAAARVYLDHLKAQGVWLDHLPPEHPAAVLAATVLRFDGG